MTEVLFKRKENKLYHLSVRGHASGDLELRICAGVSTLASSLYFALLDVADLSESDIIDSQSDGFISIEAKIYDKASVQNCFEFALSGFRMMQEIYPKEIDLKVVEV